MGVVLDILALLKEGVLAGLRGRGAGKTALDGGAELANGAEAEALGNHDRWFSNERVRDVVVRSIGAGGVLQDLVDDPL